MRFHTLERHSNTVASDGRSEEHGEASGGRRCSYEQRACSRRLFAKGRLRSKAGAPFAGQLSSNSASVRVHAVGVGSIAMIVALTYS
jgi:hypothetical protein